MVLDIVIFGKFIGNGYFFVVVVIICVIVDVFNNGMEWFNIFGGNFVLCVVGFVVFDVMEDFDLCGNVLCVGVRFKDGFIVFIG